MNELSFEHGRLSFSVETFEMEPCLPPTVEMRVQLYTLADYGFTKSGFFDFERLEEMRNEKPFIWLQLTGSLNQDFWKALGRFADLSDEQIKFLKNPHVRPTLDESYNGLCWTLIRPSVNDQFDALEIVNFYLGDRILITRQFSHDDAFTNVVHTLMAQGEALSELTVDCLAAELVESIIVSFFDVLSVGGTKLEALQNRIIRRPGKEELNMINRAQQMIWIFLKTVWPVETVAQNLSRSRSKYISDEGRHLFIQCKEEASSVLRLFETYRAMSYDIMDVYVSGLGLRTNETTKILTVIATLFLPPTLIAGIYGMNFQIPEIDFPFGYPLTLAVMFFVSGGMVWWLKKNGYIEF